MGTVRCGFSPGGLRLLAALGFSFVLCTASGAVGDGVLVLIDQQRSLDGGLVMGDVDLTGAAEWCGAPASATEITAVTDRGGEPVPAQLIPAAFDEPGGRRLAGTLVTRLPAGSDGRLRLHFGEPGPTAKNHEWDGQVRLRGATINHDAAKQSGFPSRIIFADGETAEGFHWNDRLFDKARGSYGLIFDPAAKVERLAEGPIGTVVRVTCRYLDSRGVAPPSAPQAVYDWFYVADEPLVWVRATIWQRQVARWPEIHFLEFNYPRGLFPYWVGGDSPEKRQFSGTKKSLPLKNWGAVLNGGRAIGMYACGEPRVYDGGAGTYLHAHADAAWRGWNTERAEFSAWLWIGADPDPSSAVLNAASAAVTARRILVTVDNVHERIRQARERSLSAPNERSAQWWRWAMAEHHENSGKFKEALGALTEPMPAQARAMSGGDLGCILRLKGDGIDLEGIYDTRLATMLSGRRAISLFDVVLRHLPTGEERVLTADSGWGRCAIGPPGSDGCAEITWRQSADARLGKLSVVAKVISDDNGAMRWTLTVGDVPADWSVLRVRFPKVSVDERGVRPLVLFPRGSGEVQADASRRSFRFSGTYPSGWTSMQFMAAYDAKGESGLYVAAHDPFGSTKDISLEGVPGDGSVSMMFEHPAADMGVAANGFALPGFAVWRLFRGDWFDAAVIYRDWVRREARWFPKLGPEGRGDTPQWMRELSAWTQTGGAPADCVAQVRAFAAFLGLPVGFHWYNWHQIPFDNDYPHYFPTKDGFADAARELEEAGVHVMPYINGRLWDTRDRGIEDFEYSRVALPATSKDEAGKPYEESYSSKEKDGTRVRLAAMCPRTALWHKTVNGTVMRLFGECEVSGVYIDQVAAARPTLCFDRAHGHPLGGGHWWTEGYWSMLENLRAAMPEDRILTTECNAEPYVHVFDGYLTWHWQYDGQVAAFPAVYGGSVQMFGRAYRGGPTKDLALRMKAGQQLVFGEQIGWLSPSVIKEEQNALFLRETIRLRHALRRYFHAGEMARPPRMEGTVPRVTADWQWRGTWPVTIDAIQTGAWLLPDERKLAMIFVNVGDAPLSATVDFDGARHGMRGDRLALTEITADGCGKPVAVGASFKKEIALPPRSARAWELLAK